MPIHPISASHIRAKGPLRPDYRASLIREIIPEGDHDLYYDPHTTRYTGTELEVHLVPQVNYPPKLRKIITARLDALNTGGLTLPDGSGRPLRLSLTRKEQISVRIKGAP